MPSITFAILDRSSFPAMCDANFAEFVSQTQEDEFVQPSQLLASVAISDNVPSPACDLQECASLT